MARESSKENQVTVEKKKANELVTGVVDKASKTGKKGVEIATNVLVQTASGSRALASGIAKGARDLSDKAKNDNYNKKLKKYNPLFEEEYNSDSFCVPNIIRIVDDAVRRDIDICKGAIGWRENKHGTEILFLYDEFVQKSGLRFVPVVLCDEIYYMDSHDRKCFVKLDCVFQQSHEEKIAELEHIAYSLGAKKCVIEIEEEEIMHDKKRKRAEAKEGRKKASAKEEVKLESEIDSVVKRTSKSETQFKGNVEVIAPALKWFAHDNNILNLIEYRCKRRNEITSRTLELSGYSSATMSRNAAYSIDAAVAEMGIRHDYSMEAKSVRECSMKIIYQVEF